MAMSIPGIDETMGFCEVLKLLHSMQFSVVVFDTAPTGHTLRFLSIPTSAEKYFSKIVGLKSKFSSIFKQFSTLLGTGAETEEQITNKLEQTSSIVEEVNKQFKNPELTTFICVCIPEFLSLYETERMVQELNKFEIDVQNIVVNQILYPDSDQHCRFCSVRSKMQQKYLEQIHDLYEDFHIVHMPLLENEIRGQEALWKFSEYLFKPFKSAS